MEKTTGSKPIAYFETSNVMMFKKLSFLSKSFFSKKIRFQFSNEKVVISLTNHQKMSEIIAIFENSNTNDFFCEESTILYISSSEFQIIFNKIDSKYKRIKIDYQKTMKDKRVYIHLETTHNISEFHSIELSNINFNKVQIYKEKNRESYPILVVNYKTMKALITSIKDIASNFILEIANKKFTANIMSENRKILSKITIPVESHENVYEDTSHYLRLGIKDFKYLSILNCSDKITMYVNKDDDFVCIFEVNHDKIIYCITQYDPNP